MFALAVVAWAVLTIPRRRRPDGVPSAVAFQDGSTPNDSTHCAAEAGGLVHPVHPVHPVLPARTHPVLRTVLWTGALTILVFVVAGPAAVAVPVCAGVWALGRRRRAVLAWVAGCAEVLAGIAIAAHPGYRIGVLAGSGSYTAQALGVLALAALAVSLLPGLEPNPET
jgi:hypothetical protein